MVSISPASGCLADQGLDSLDESGHSRLMKRWMFNSTAPRSRAKLEVLPEPCLAVRPQRIGLQARVDR